MFSSVKKISMIIDERFKAIRKVEQTRLGAGPIMEIISAVAIAIVVFFAGYRSIQGAITLGEFVSFLAALMPQRSIRENLALTRFRGFTNWGRIKSKDENKTVDNAATTAYTINIILGGIKIPRQPPAVTTPEANVLL